MADKLKVAVVGVGDFGRQHARVYRSLPDVELAGVFDTNAARARAVAEEFGTRALPSLEAVASEATAATVAVPTAAHAAVAGELLERGCDVLVEKPIATSLAEADALVGSAARLERILEVGHTERFNPAVRAAAAVVKEPLFFEVHRLGVFSGRSTDVDVIFDVMIHDLDILLSFVPSEVEQVHAVGIPILTPKVDIASVHLEFASGCVANLTASRVSNDRVRKLRFFQPHTYVSIDYARQDVLVIRVDADATLAAGSGWPAGLDLQKLEVVKEEPLHAELGAFVQSVRTRRSTGVSGAEARRALALAERVAAGIAEHARKLPPAATPAAKA